MAAPNTGGHAPGWEWHLAETYKALITISVEALKLLALANGGAAVAVLTYLGNLAGKPGAHLPDLKPTLLWYSGGLFATIFAFVIAYVSQLRLFVEERARHSGKPFRVLHWIGVLTGVLLALIASVAFGLGSWAAADALTQR